MAKPPESLRQRQHDRGLTLPQQNAVELLTTGKTDTATAEALGLARETVTRWRLYDPVFRAALHRARASIWQHSTDRLRSLYGNALDAIEATLTDPDHPDRWRAAVALLKLLNVSSDDLASGPQDPERLVENVVQNERERVRCRPSETLDLMAGLPSLEEQIESTWRELEIKAGVAGPVQ